MAFHHEGTKDKEKQNRLCGRDGHGEMFSDGKRTQELRSDDGGCEGVDHPGR